MLFLSEKQLNRPRSSLSLCVRSLARWCVHVYTPPGPLLLGFTEPLISASLSQASIFIPLNARVQPSPLDSCSWINIVYFLIERGAHRGPELALLPRARPRIASPNTTHTRSATHTRSSHTGISFISHNEPRIIHVDPSRIRHQSDFCLCSDPSLMWRARKRKV